MRARWLQSLWPPADAVAFRPTTLEERAAFSRLIPGLLAAAPTHTRPPEALLALAGRVGFHLEVRRWRGEVLWVLREREGAHRGAGAYVLRTGPATDDVIQSPHADHDVGTGQLAAGLFLCAPEGRRPRAFATSTVHRYLGHKRSAGEHPADVAHNPGHLFQVVTDLMAQSLPGLRVLQLHGFAARGASREELVAVVSAGAVLPSPWSRQVARQLTPVLGGGVRLYPDQTKQLGGTRNAQARLLQAYPHSRFLHLELSREVRRALRSQERLVQLASVLLAPEED